MESVPVLWSRIVTASWELVFVSVGFLLLGYLARGNAVSSTLQRSWFESKLNLAYHYLDVLLVLPLATLTVEGTSFLVARAGLAVVEPSSYDRWPWVVAIGVGIVASDFIGYWRHRLMHTTALWPVHAIHHSDTVVTWLTLARFHPVNRLVTVALNATLLAILGLPVAAIGLGSLVRHFHGYYVHADLAWTHGALRYVFVSPVMHRWHHVREVEGSGSNFASIFSAFDVLFGTYNVPDRPVPELGISETGFPNHWLGQTLYPFRIWARGLLRQALFHSGK